MRVLIVGVGAIGSAFLAFLTKAGHQALGLLREGRERIEKLKVEGIWGSFSVPVKTTDRLEGIPSPELVIISVKSFDTKEALLRIRPVVSERTHILIAQNGYGNYEAASEVYGEEKVILSRIIFGAKKRSREEVFITVSADDVVIGNPSPRVDADFVKKVVEVIGASGIPTRYEREVYKFLWDKIIYNSALNPLGALLEVNYGTLASDPSTCRVMDEIIVETFRVLEAKGIETFWKDAQEYIKHFYTKLVPPTREHYPSMLEDIRRGKTEIDSLNGAVLKLGKEAGIDTPVNGTVVNLVKAKERLYSERVSS